jgi:Uma2 family endonuclease
MASTPPKARPATYADLFALPENVIGEIIDGDLVVSPRPAPRHAIATSHLGGELTGPYGRGRGGPGWLRERMPRAPETAWFELRPDWACEVLSPSTAILDRTRKQDICREHGVPWLWFVDPGTRTIEVLKLSGQDLVVAGNFGGDGEMRIPPFDAVAIDVGALWDSTPTNPTA